MRGSARAWVVVLFITAAVGMAAMRLLAVDRPTGVNDLSRWLTVRALVENHTYVIGKLGPGGLRRGLVGEEGWDTLDKLVPSGSRSFVSDKPPAYSTVVAGGYWVLHQLGWRYPRDTAAITHAILFGWHIVPLFFYLLVLAWLAGRAARTELGELYVVGAACFATFLPVYTSVLSNHPWGCYATLFAVAFFLEIWEGRGSPWKLVLCGLLAGWAFVCELPAAALCAVLTGLLLVRSPGPTLRWFIPAALIPVGLFFATNQLAYGTWGTPWGRGWLNYNGSYWRQPGGIDVMERNRLVYAFHYLIGHHGVFSLTPIFLCALPGVFGTWRRALIGAAGVAGSILATAYLPWQLGLVPAALVCLWRAGAPWGWWTREPDTVFPRLTFVCTVALFSFWLSRNAIYGGITVGPRHVMWLTPLLLLSMIPTVDKLARTTRGKLLLLALLLPSLYSAFEAGGDPWQHPWIYRALGLG